MNPQQFPFGPVPTQRVSIRRRFGRRVDIAFGYYVLATKTRMGRFHKGQTYPLSDGSQLEVQRSSPLLHGGWTVRLNGRSLPGSVGTHAHARVIGRRVGLLLAVLAMIHWLAWLGVSGLCADSWIATNPPVHWLAALPGPVLALLGAMEFVRSHPIALAMAFGLLLADGIASWIPLPRNPEDPLLIAHASIRLLCLISLALGWCAIQRAQDDVMAHA